MNTATGQCLCGSVTFTVNGALRDVYNCHCVRCRRFTGHHMAATAADTEDLTIDSGASLLTWFYPVPEAAYAFCQTCGSSLFWRSGQTPEVTSICAGVLDPPTHLRTTLAWWTRDASDYAARADLVEFDTE
ncbi:MAG: GFA family protein [Ornithinimicrobium sp.]